MLEKFKLFFEQTLEKYEKFLENLSILILIIILLILSKSVLFDVYIYKYKWNTFSLHLAGPGGGAPLVHPPRAWGHVPPARYAPSNKYFVYMYKVQIHFLAHTRMYSYSLVDKQIRMLLFFINFNTFSLEISHCFQSFNLSFLQPPAQLIKRIKQ